MRPNATILVMNFGGLVHEIRGYSASAMFNVVNNGITR